MPVKVYLTRMLVRHVNIKPELTVDADSLGALFRKLDEEHQGFLDSVCDETGKIRTFVNVFLNGQKVEQDSGFQSTVLSDGDEVYILASVAGGLR